MGLALVDSVLLTATTWYMTVSSYFVWILSFIVLTTCLETARPPHECQSHLLPPSLLRLARIRNLPQCRHLVVEPQRYR